VSYLSPLAGLSALESLYLRSTPVSDLSPLAGLSALEQLVLNDTQVWNEFLPISMPIMAI
jgi:internalin A